MIDIELSRGICEIFYFPLINHWLRFGLDINYNLQNINIILNGKKNKI